MLIKNLLKCRNISISQCRKKSTNRNILNLRERGMFHDLFPDNSANSVVDLLNASPQCVYGGFDPTADSLHVGNLLILTNLIHWQRGGHQVIALVGGATAKIGDPSGRTTERDPLTTKFVDDNVEGIHKNIKTIFENHEKHFWNEETKKLLPVKILNNENWYKQISAVDLIGGAGRHLRMGTLISRTSVQTRLKSSEGMSFTEFSYQLFQAYDWLYLFQKHNCKFQVGGSDQMGNMMSGHELISKVCKQPVFGLTLPIITTEMGDKFGKSAGNAVWLSPQKTSPFTFYQFWMRQTDAEVEKMLLLFSFLSVGEIKDLMRQHHEKPELRKPQKILADQVTLLVHGEEGLNSARLTTKALYQGSVAALGNLKAEQIAEIFQGATIVELLPEPGQSILDLAMKVQCFPRIEDAVRIISAGGFYINQQKANNPNEILNNNVHRLSNNVSLLRVGKKNYYVVKWI
ncbi:tyrosine--tRNA ligase, mitochondrial [Coccinella septempunctata]|uniref:tyrosine--tRNA ligase, mitochondrial n=1 Tax=Coccinella septempunctata TaxID=41139 RepID=UPI001D086B81|nr:tyrosine--tRNA ligase, mitochondrial [Coccinella septempunctata]